MTDFLLSANQLCWAARRSGTRFSEADIAAFRTLYDAIVGAGEALHPEVELPIWQGGRAKQSVACNLLRRFRKHADAILLFIRDLAVPFTNNVAERAVRMPKVKQKISGCFRTVEGADNFCVIRSCLDNAAQAGPRYAGGATTRLRRQSYPAHCIDAEQSQKNLVDPPLIDNSHWKINSE